MTDPNYNVPSIFAAPGASKSAAAAPTASSYNSTYTSQNKTTPNAPTSYTPSAAASTYTPSSSSYTPSAAASSYTPSAAASSYTPSAAASSYVPSAAAQYSAPTGGQGYSVPSMFAAPSQPTSASTTTANTNAHSKPATQSSYQPSAAALSYKPSAAASTYQPSAAAMSYQPSAAASTYKPSAAAMSSQYSSPATGNQQYNVPSMFAPPPPGATPAPKPKPPKKYNTHTSTSSSAPSKPTPSAPSYEFDEPQIQNQTPPHVMNAQQRKEFEASQPEALRNHADIWMISGCEDRQTSADVANVNSFQLPDPHGRAGGACTAALLNVLYNETNDPHQHDYYTFTDVMMKMRKLIKQKRLSQIPQLSALHAMDLHQRFQMVPDSVTGRRRAVIIGINYKGQRGELKGCHNDAMNMKKFMLSHYGFQERDMKLLLDDGKHTQPTKANILAAYKKIVAESRPGDAVFLHYSGHGTKVRDLNGDEADGYDEALCPLDVQRTGPIIDDDIYKIIVEGLPNGVYVSAVMDCCHSGTILDLPYVFKANGQFSKMEIEESYNPNKLFSFFGGGGGAAQMVGAAVVGALIGGLLG